MNGRTTPLWPLGTATKITFEPVKRLTRRQTRAPRSSQGPPGGRLSAKPGQHRVLAVWTSAGEARGRGRASVQDFLAGGGALWPLPASDFLYSDIELFGLSDFGFLASLLLRI